jgi:FkbM family methyltransferase
MRSRTPGIVRTGWIILEGRARLRCNAQCMSNEEKEKQLVRDYLGDKPGVFIEVGANHPRHGSQSWHLAERGWRGIVIEPQSKFHALLQQERPESFVVRAACTSPERGGTITIHIPSEDGFATVEPNKDDFYIRYEATESVDAKPLDAIVAEWRAATGEAAAIRFVAIDVEGHELEVLRGFCLAVHQPDLILIEDKLQDLSKHRHLTAAGYRLVRRTCLNNWYIPRDACPPRRSLGERAKLFRKVFLGLPFRALRRWRHKI